MLQDNVFHFLEDFSFHSADNIQTHTSEQLVQVESKVVAFIPIYFWIWRISATKDLPQMQQFITPCHWFFHIICITYPVKNILYLNNLNYSFPVELFIFCHKADNLFFSEIWRNKYFGH